MRMRRARSPPPPRVPSSLSPVLSPSLLTWPAPATPPPRLQVPEPLTACSSPHPNPQVSKGPLTGFQRRAA